MSLQGDLSTLDLADLLQNLEGHGKSGVLTIEGSSGLRRLYFQDGRLALLGAEGRPNLMGVLVACGAISVGQLEAARKKRRRTKKSLGEVLVANGAISEEALREIAATRLLDEGCELIATGGGAFTFGEGNIPRGLFDPEERRLGLALAAGPLLMESARREDHWRLVRAQVPSDSAHYVVERAPQALEGVAPEILEGLLMRLDGTRSVAEVVAPFPHRRFEAYIAFAQLVEHRMLRMANPEDLVRLAHETADSDKERASLILRRGLEMSPRNLDLLCARALLAENVGELEEAAESLKMVVHLKLESGDREGAREDLEKAKVLDPADAAVWERSFDLALIDGRAQDAVADGSRLAELFRGPGLHKKAVGVLETLVELEPDTWQLRRELAHARADCGELEAAVQDLERYGKRLMALEDHDVARRSFVEILSIDPTNANARATLDLIESGELARRRRRRRRLVRRASAVLTLTFVTTWLVYESLARGAYLRAERAVSDAELVEERRYAEAIEEFEAVRQRYPFASTAFFDVRTRLRGLSSKLRRSLEAPDAPEAGRRSDG